MSNKLIIIDREINKHQKEISKLHSVKEMIWRGEIDNELLKECPMCKTKNYHWNVSSNTWTCAFC